MMNYPEERYCAEIDTIADSVRNLARMALENTDNQKMLQLLGHIGGMATHALELQEVPATDMSEAVSASLTTTMQTGARTEPSEEVPPCQNALEVLTTSPAGTETDEPVGLAQYSRELQLTKREHTMMQVLLGRAGQQVAPAELKAMLDGTPSARGQAVSAFFRKLQQSPYADRLLVEGRTSGRRYTWLPEEGMSPLVSEKQASPKVTPLAMPRQQVIHGAVLNEQPWASAEDAGEDDEATIHEEAETAEAARLDRFGIEVHGEEGSRYISINKVQLSLTSKEAEIFRYVAGQDKGVLFLDVLQKFGAASRGRAVSEIQQSLVRIAQELKNFDQLQWDDFLFSKQEFGRQKKLRFIGLSVEERLKPSSLGGGVGFLALPTRWAVPAPAGRKEQPAMVDDTDAATASNSEVRPQQPASSDGRLQDFWAAVRRTQPLRRDWEDDRNCDTLPLLADQYPEIDENDLLLTLCRFCTVRDECLDEGLKAGVTQLVYGGLTKKSRTTISRLLREGKAPGEVAEAISTARQSSYERAQKLLDESTERGYSAAN